jgi:putative transcriptional regulator
MPIAVDIDVMLARRKMSVGELADRVGITPANLAVLKNGRAKAVRFATLAALCEVLECQPGDLLRWEAEGAAGETPLASRRAGRLPRHHRGPGVIAIAEGRSSPAGTLIGLSAVLVAVWIGVTVPAAGLKAYTVLPSGVITM